MLGNHRDAWVFGGIDPSSGTACLMEIARALGNKYKQGTNINFIKLLSVVSTLCMQLEP